MRSYGGRTSAEKRYTAGPNDRGRSASMLHNTRTIVASWNCHRIWSRAVLGPKSRHSGGGGGGGKNASMVTGD